MTHRSFTAVRWTIAFFVLGICLGSSQAISLDRNGYEFTVALSEDVLEIANDQRIPFLEALKVILLDFLNLIFYYIWLSYYIW